MLVNVRLVGDMADVFGMHHQFHVDAAREVFKALEANFQGFRSYLVGSQSRGVDYQVLLDEIPHNEQELKFASAPRNMVVAPVISGSGGVFKVITGLALLVVSAFAPFSIGLLGYGSILGSTVGTYLVLSGASDLFVAKDGSKVDRSTGINSVGTISDGEVIPVGYGRIKTKGRVISAATTVRRR